MLTPEAVTPPSTPPEKRLWGFWPTAGFAAAILTTYFAVQSAIATIIFFIRFPGSGLDLLEALQKLNTDGFALSVAEIVSVALGTLLIAVFIRLKGGISFADYVGFKKPGWKTLVISALVFAVMIAVVYVVSNYAGDQGDSEFSAELYRSSVFPPLLWLAIVFLGPFFEELFFRGFLFVGLRASKLGVIATVILTSLLWAALHLQYGLFGISQILVMGIVLGTVRHKTNNLWSTILIHVLWNGAALIATAVYVNQGGG
jgi:uncharacterized protein